MQNFVLPPILLEQLSQIAGSGFHVTAVTPVSGGCIHRAMSVSGPGARFFVKMNEAACLAMFEAEADGLRALAASGAVRVPALLAIGHDSLSSWLVLDYLELAPPPAGSLARLGEVLALLHSARQPEFGWYRDNYIGTTAQSNSPSSDWSSFWRERRLLPQLELARANGYRALVDAGEKLASRVDMLLDSPHPSLLHGDLWSGNAAFLRDGTPVLLDPAVYRGAGEADLAMTELFGGFGQQFRSAYTSVLPLAPGYPVRRDLYNLYHVLNHLNLFGQGYLSQAQDLIARLLAEAG